MNSLFNLRNLFFVFILLTLVGPLWVIASGQVDLKTNWREANRDSSNIAPNPLNTPEAIVQVYSARTYSWRGIFAVHTWIAVKPANAKQYIVYQVVGWRLFQGLSPVKDEPDIPDRYWFGQKPLIIYAAYGKTAEDLIPKIAQAVASYPYANQYNLWPGPNSNTFTAYIARQIPEMHLTLPSNAIGKDYLSNLQFFSRTPSDTGYQFSILGVFGVMLAVQEGLEINIFGLVYGISPETWTLKLPGFGDIHLLKMS